MYMWVRTSLGILDECKSDSFGNWMMCVFVLWTVILGSKSLSGDHFRCHLPWLNDRHSPATHSIRPYKLLFKRYEVNFTYLIAHSAVGVAVKMRNHLVLWWYFFSEFYNVQWNSHIFIYGLESLRFKICSIKCNTKHSVAIQNELNHATLFGYYYIRKRSGIRRTND